MWLYFVTYMIYMVLLVSPSITEFPICSFWVTMGHPLYPAKLAITSVPADGLVTCNFVFDVYPVLYYCCTSFCLA